MRVLIIGAGYIGAPLGAELVRRGHDVSALRRDRSTAAELQAAGLKPLFADITDPSTLAKLPRNFDWVVNCASSGANGPDAYRRIYVGGMRNIIEWLIPNASALRFVYTSSTSVYGQNDGSVVVETSPSEPAAESARILLEAERELLTAARQQSFSAMILRVAGIYGPERGYWFKQFITDAARIEGHGERFLNMIHRDDVVGCIIAALNCGRGGEIYNACDDEPVSQFALFSWLASTLGKPMPASVPDSPEVTRKRGVTNKRVSNQKLKAELGYHFKYATFREGFSAEIQKPASEQK